MNPNRSPHLIFLFGEFFPKWSNLPPDTWQHLPLTGQGTASIKHLFVAKETLTHYYVVEVEPFFALDDIKNMAHNLSRTEVDQLILVIKFAGKDELNLVFWQRQDKTYYHLDLSLDNPIDLETMVMRRLKRRSGEGFKKLFDAFHRYNPAALLLDCLSIHLAKRTCHHAAERNALIVFLYQFIGLIFLERRGHLNQDPNYLEHKMALCDGRGYSLISGLLRPIFATLEGGAPDSPVPLGQISKIETGMFLLQEADLPDLPNDWISQLYDDLKRQFRFSFLKAQGRILAITPDLFEHTFAQLFKANQAPMPEHPATLRQTLCKITAAPTRCNR